jgi:hypothetical protein
MVKAGGNLNPFPPHRCANMHAIEAYADLDSIIDYALSKHEVDFDDSGDGNKDNDNGTELLAYVAGQKNHVEMFIKFWHQNRHLIGRRNARWMRVLWLLTIDGTTYSMHKVETITFQGHQYLVHMTKCHYRMGQHDISDMEYVLVHRGTNGGICGSDMKIL